MTSQLELHLLARLDDISAGVARLEEAFDNHLAAHKAYDEAKKFNAELRRGRLRMVLTTAVTIITSAISLAIWKALT
jgi:hypothetical protein